MIAGALILLLIIGGAYAASRRATAMEGELRRRVTAANEALAHARSEDRGWELSSLETAARSAFQARGSGLTVDELHLVQVVDRPGTDHDQAVFELHAGGGVHMVTLGRQDGSWVALD